MAAENAIRSIHLVRVSPFNVIFVVRGPMLIVKVFFRDQFKAIKSLSSLHNFVYYCQANDCASHIKNITFEWIQSRATPQANAEAADITTQQLSSEHNTIQKAMTDLSAKTDIL